MLLAIDVGNTNSKFAVFDGDKLVSQYRLRTEAKRTADEYAAWVTQLMHCRASIPGPSPARSWPASCRAVNRTCGGCARPISTPSC
jgi:pantothenate kinase type III